MSNQELVDDFFSEHIENFMIYVVEQKFAVNRGRDFFKQYINKEHFINSDSKIKVHLSKTLKWIQKKIPDIADLTKHVMIGSITKSPLGIVDLVTSLSKLFTVTEHQAVGPTVIDPIIIEEVNISAKYIAQLVSLYKESTFEPAIIIILQDNNIERAKSLLSKCPHNTNVKFIRNDGNAEVYKIINIGTDNINDFVDAFSRQCFSTCSKTDRGVLLNNGWDNDNIVRSMSPHFFKARSHLLFDEKPAALDGINSLLDEIARKRDTTKNNEVLLNSLDLMAKLNRVYCRDTGGTDIDDALALSKELDIELLKAYVYRFAHFIPNITRDRQKELLLEAGEIFKRNNVSDHAIYCQNNFLVHSFYSDTVDIRRFRDLQQKAINDVPGMVGMSIILNNVGVAYLYKRDLTEATIFLEKGIHYAKERIVQKIGLQSNLLITKACKYEMIEEKEIRMMCDLILANFSEKYLPFIASNYILNLVAIALEQHYELGKTIFEMPKVRSILASSLVENTLGSGSLTRQILKLQSRFSQIDFTIFSMPKNISQLSGVREEFIMEKGYNPIIFNAWL